MRTIAAIILCVLACSQVKCQDVDIESRIIGGVTLAPTEPLLRVAVFLDYTGTIICTGSIIHPEWLLTSARCGTKVRDNHLRVQFGVVTNPTYNGAFLVRQIIVHPSFVSTTGLNDIALVELQAPIDRAYRSLIIPDKAVDLQGKNLLVMGYGVRGRDTNGNPLPKGTLASREVSLADITWCRAQTTMLTNQMCSVRPIACDGDSGSPLILDNDNYLVGLVSMRTEQLQLCDAIAAVRQTVYISVIPYKPWMKLTTKLTYL